jgi:UDP-N-acetylmuramyl pentapeptide phosphotransferase/UDP-N-acetylglucosamine-1-phosphate transferase
LRWVFGGLLLALGAWISTFGIARVLLNTRLRECGVNRHVSGLPIIGPVMFILGWMISPLSWSWWSLFIVALDIDTLLVVFYLPFLLLLNRSAGTPQQGHAAGDRRSRDRG